jgi:hypothetical protein
MICDLAKALAEETTERENLERDLTAVTEQRDMLAEALDMLDEVIKKMRPRYMGHPTMDGRFPCWTVWMPHTGTTERKSLKEAVLEYIAAVKGGGDE